MNRRRRAVAGAVALAMVVCLSAGCGFDRRFVFQPRPWKLNNLAKRSGLPIEDVELHTSDGVMLHGWFIPAPTPLATLLWCHGNAGNMTDRLDKLAELYRRHLSIFIFDYRGYGQSHGVPSEDGLYRDAQAAYAYLIDGRHLDPKRVVLFGRSLGCAVAGDLATQRPAAGLILESPFSSLQEVIRTRYGNWPLEQFFDSNFDLLAKMPRIHMPVLIIHGDRDEVVPLSLGQRVYDAANPPKDFYLIAGAHHDDMSRVGGKRYFERFVEFVQNITQDAPTRETEKAR